MQKQDRTTYLIQFQYLGFRLHGWAKQTGLKTVHERIDKTIAFIFQHSDFKTMGTSRTDALVSANSSSFMLMSKPISKPDDFLTAFNLNLPPDIRALLIKEVEPNFNPLDSHRTKTYMYLFSSGEKPHPFCAPLLTSILKPLDLASMQEAATLFKGEHDFWNYATKSNKATQTIRNIESCEIVKNTFYTASFFPKETYALKISSKGFLRNQVRLIMGQLFRVGKQETGLDFIEESLQTRLEKPLREIAPGSGLILHSIY